MRSGDKMLYWESKFNIPDSGVQSAEVFAVPSFDEDVKLVTVQCFADQLCQNLLFERAYEVAEEPASLEDFVLALPEFKKYAKI